MVTTTRLLLSKSKSYISKVASTFSQAQKVQSQLHLRHGSSLNALSKQINHPKIDLSFTNAEIAYRSKSTFELLRALIVFTLCSNNFIVNNNKFLIEWSRKLLGKKLFRKLQFASFYGHFVAGEDQESIKPTVSRNRMYGVKSILDYSVEKDVSEAEAQSIVKEGLEEVMDNTERAEEMDGRFQTSLEFAQRSKLVDSARTYYYQGEKECDRHMETFMSCINAVANSTNVSWPEL